MTEKPENKEEKVVALNPEFEKEISEKEHFTGEFLKKVRLYRGVSLQEISKVTNVSVRYFKAIEEDDLSPFAAHVFLKGFLRQYAKKVHLDPEKVVQGYVKLKSFTNEG
ncbi:MAG TPA: helix-turn-helix transcriptional regulator [Bdellovibrionota bacterium]|nr:helix-turn-helix transcriptional regulator [Bdellovibrionota bacterium]